MKEITILSGKGGTGKTTITAALASLAKNAVLCDNDVDAADLHLILRPIVKEKCVFEGAWQANVTEVNCNNCGSCIEICRFGAIEMNSKGFPEVNPYKCEGCRLCERICTSKAIVSEQSKNNFWYLSDTRFGQLVHARMGPGEENSGKLVSTVRRKAKEVALDIGAEYIINDGPPGIGCSAISALSGTNLVVLVTEPSKSGLFDARRLVELAQSFKIPVVAVINKSDINKEICDELMHFFAKQCISVLAKIPFHTDVVEAMVHAKTLIEFDSYSEISMLINQLWESISKVEVKIK